MSRWKASLIHLLISFIVVGSVAAYVIGFWYPPALLRMAQADVLLLMIGGIDLIVGPLLTLVVYKHGKPSLRMDLTVIALLQVAFLSYGVYTTFKSRPVFMVASAHVFDLVFANEISPEELAKGSEPAYRSLGVTRPVLVGLCMPSDRKVLTDIAMSVMAGGGDMQTMPRFYCDYQKVVPDLLANAHPLVPGPKLTPESAASLVKAARHYGRAPEDVRYMHLNSVRGNAAMLIDARNADVVGPADVDY